MPEDYQSNDKNVNDDEYFEANELKLPGDSHYHQKSPDFKTKKPTKLNKKTFIGLSLVLLIFAIAFASWKFIPSKREQTGKDNDNSGSNAQSQATQAQSTDSQELTTEYTNDFLALSFKHPDNWKVNEENDVIDISSPTISFILEDGDTTDGYFKIIIKKGSDKDDSKYLGRGYAIDKSRKIDYSEPALGQRASTFITNFGLGAPDNFAYFVVQGNFELKKSDTLGPNFAHEPDAYLIVGGFTEPKNEGIIGSSIASLASYDSDQNYLTAVKIIKTLKIK